ncbi:MAG: type II secretion system protein [Acidobacteriota bacterium]
MAIMARLRQTRRANQSGFTFIELVVSTAIIAILASGAIPLARVSMRRTREAELHRALREVRMAIDKFKDAADQQIISPLELQAGGDGYPKDLQQLVDGVALNNDASGKKMRFLRRIPIDPITGRADWKLRAYGDDAKSTVWGGGNVYAVASKSDGTALDGTKYKDW